MNPETNRIEYKQQLIDDLEKATERSVSNLQKTSCE